MVIGFMDIVGIGTTFCTLPS